MNWYWKSLCRVLVGDLTYPSKIELVNAPVQSFKQNGEQGGKCSFSEQSCSGNFTTMDIRKQREGKPVKQVVRTLKLNLSSACQAGGTAIVTSLSFVIPVSCWGEVSVSPASRGSSYLTGYWRKIKRQGNGLGIKQNCAAAESAIVHFCFSRGELIFFKIVHPNL